MFMIGAERAFSSQPLVPLGVKTASGGKNAVRRFASGASVRNPAGTLRKIGFCGGDRVRHPIFGNTIGSLVGDGIAAKKATDSSAPAPARTLSAEDTAKIMAGGDPTVTYSVGGSDAKLTATVSTPQSNDAPQPDDIVVTARRNQTQYGNSDSPSYFDSVLSVSMLRNGKLASATGKPATMFSSDGLTRLPGLYVKGNTLMGTVLVDFTNYFGVDGDISKAIDQLKLINQKTSDGYAINLNIRQNTFWDDINVFSSPVAHVSVLFVKDMSSTRCDGALACYDPNIPNIKVSVGASNQEVEHEFAHNLGLGHNSISGSLMSPYASPSNPIKLQDQEIRNIVNAYRSK
jgi:hypothetical protein